MKADLDRLMAARDLAAIIVAYDEVYNAPVDYLTNGADITRGLVIKPQGADAVVIANPMETEEAARSGLTVYSFYDMGWAELLEANEGNRTRAEVQFWGQCLERLGVASGKIGIYGTGEFNVMLALVDLLRAAYAQYEFVGEMGLSLFDEAYVTKDADEIERMRDIARRTSATMQATWDFIQQQRFDGETVVTADGQPLTIGMVRRFVRRTLLEHDLEDTGMIFAQGRDAGFPHSRGEDEMPLRAGQSIVFDLFPREVGGGYHHDMTRTWCIGYAPPEVQQAYDQVMEAFDRSLEMMRIDQPTKDVQIAVQEFFESLGHATSRSQPDTTEGYVHSLGHGVGLKIHERPGMSHHANDTLQAGNVITVEPGLYYPERGFGVRIEDSVVLHADGSVETLTNFHKQLVLPIGE